MSMRFLVVALLVATAGCTTLTGSEEPETVTPAAVPTDDPADAPAQVVVPGVYADGEIDVSWLVDAHREALANQSFVWRATRNWSGQVGNVSSQFGTFQEITFEEGTRYVRDTNQDLNERGEPIYIRYSEYANGSDRYTRSIRYLSGEVEYNRINVSDSTARLMQRITAPVALYLSADSVRSEPVRIDGESHYRIDVRSAPDTVNTGISNYSVTAFVTPDGIVRNLSVVFTRSNGDAAETIRSQFQFEKIGNVTVDEPSWVADARANLTAG